MRKKDILIWDLEKTRFYAVVVARNVKPWHSTTGHYYYVQPPLLSRPFAHLCTHSLSHFLPLPRTLQGLASPRRAFPSSARENFLVEFLRRHGDGIESLSSCCSGGGGGIPKHERADAFEMGERERKRRERGGGKGRTYSNSPSFDRTRAIVCNSVREFNRNSPLSRLPYALLFLMNPSSLSRPSRLQIAIVIADQ